MRDRAERTGPRLQQIELGPRLEVEARDPRLQRGLQWLERNQRESGRWWTRSLNTDRGHFVTYSGTAYPLLALAMSGRVPSLAAAPEPGRGQALALSEITAGR